MRAQIKIAQRGRREGGKGEIEENTDRKEEVDKMLEIKMCYDATKVALFILFLRLSVSLVFTSFFPPSSLLPPLSICQRSSFSLNSLWTLASTLTA